MIVGFELRGTHKQVIHGAVKVRGSDMSYDLSMVYGFIHYWIEGSCGMSLTNIT